MPCYYPRTAYRSMEVNPSGKRSLTFNPTKGYYDSPLKIPCGQCIGCRLERSRQWAIRCVHEVQLSEENCFITLTYNPEHLPEKGTLVKKDFQDFMKRLRKKNPEKKIKYYHCGEYGEVCKNCGYSKPKCVCGKFEPVLGRPHYHAILFGFDFQDKKEVPNQHGDHKYYRSEELESTWGKGHTLLGAATFESAAYVARYITKKINGEKEAEHYKGRLKEYTTMSLKPPIGKDWWVKYKSEVYPSDSVVIRGKEMRPPKYYDKRFEVENPEGHQKLKMERISKGAKFEKENTPARLRTKREVTIAGMKKMNRKL